ncbi:MAG: thiamine-binding protein [Tissierellia bacterium]|nr:thiamine-binding protein [Tissierellia bacterium]
MNCAVAIQVLPQVEGKAEVVRIVDEVIAEIDKSGFSYTVSPFETVIEGEFEALMELIARAQERAIEAGAPSLLTYLKINYQPDGGLLTTEEKVGKYHS